MEYQKYLKSEHWKVLRTEKITGKERCCLCHKRRSKNSGLILDVHHIKYKNLYDVETTDLRVLCRNCHYILHDLMKHNKIMYNKTKSHHSNWATIKNQWDSFFELDYFYKNKRKLKLKYDEYIQDKLSIYK